LQWEVSVKSWAKYVGNSETDLIFFFLLAFLESHFPTSGFTANPKAIYLIINIFIHKVWSVNNE